MKLDDIKHMVRIARKAGLKIEETDYGWTVGAHRLGAEKALIISEVYRPERDGYTGGRLITEGLLREWIEKNP